MGYSLKQVIDIFNTKVENILVVDEDCVEERKVAAIYFSSLAIIPPPKDIDSFVDAIIKKDRYEWFGTRIKCATRHVFVRDLELTWYQHGNSDKANTIDKLAERLRMLTEGFETICVGSSAGGYASMLFAKLIGAKACFAFSPCIDVNRFIQGNREINKNSELWQDKYDELLKSPGKYNNLMTLYRDNEIPIYAYFPTQSPLDNIELEDARKIPSMHLCLHESNVHGFTFSRKTVEKLINVTLAMEIMGRGVNQSYESLYCGISLSDGEIAARLDVPIDEVAALRKGYRYKLRKYKAKNYLDYLLASTLNKLCVKLIKYLNGRGLSVKYK